MRQHAPLLPTESKLPAAFIGDVAALCIATWSSSDCVKPTHSPNACCSSAGTAAAASAACAAAATSGTLLLAGIGSQLLVYELPSGRLLCCEAALPSAARLHGIAWLPCPAEANGRPVLLVAVHGGRHAALLRLLGPAAAAQDGGDSDSDGHASWELQLLTQLRFLEWTMEVQLAPSSGCSAQLAVGLSSNAVQLFAVLCSVGGSGDGTRPRCALQQLGQVECSERSLLYSMALLPRQQQPCGDNGSNSSERVNGSNRGGSSQRDTGWLVAAGTILHDVLVWAVPEPASHPAAAATAVGGSAAQALLVPSERRTVVAPLFRLKGHVGSVHSVRWSPCGQLLASGSDDRSLRVWSIPQPSPDAAQPPSTSQAGATAEAAVSEREAGREQAAVPELQPLHTLWGHGGRLWDCCFGGGAWASGGDAGSSSSSSSGSNSGGGGEACSRSGVGSSSLGSGSWTGGLGSFLVTASEDCTCRVWCLATGRQLAVVEGHRGRGPWSCALLSRSTPAQLATAAPPNNAAHAAGEEQAAAAGTAQEAASAAAAAGCYLLTGGADASIKCWTLADWLPSPAAAACPAPAAGAEFYTLQGLPPCPEATAVGQCRSYELLAAQHSAQQAQQDDGAQQELQQGQQAEAGAVTARDSRAEWARCLALASDVRWSAGSGGGSSSSANSNSSGGGSSSSSSGGPSPQPCQQRQLYVATNRGLVHRVQLPDARQGLPERWECIHKAGASGDARPYLALRVLPQPACPAGQPGSPSSGSSGSSSADSGSSVWLALSDLAGTATILLDHPCGSISSSGGGISSSGSSAGARCVAHWRPYSSCAGPAGVWWGSSSSGGGGGTLGNAAGLGSRYCFTTGGKQLVTAWLLPPLSAAATAEQTRLAEAQLPFAGYANAVAAAALPWLQPGKAAAAAAAAALVAVGDSSGSVTVLLLVLPGGLQQQEPCAPEADRTAAPNGTATAPAQQPASLAGGSGSARLVPLAAARRVHAGTPVRAVQLRLPALARGASLEQQLAAVEVVTAGGDGAAHTLRLPAAAVAAALRMLGTLAADAGASAQPVVEVALAALQLGNGSQETAASHGSASVPAAEAARPAAEQCTLPRLLAAASRRYEAVTHIAGILPAALDSSGGGSRSAGGVVYGFHASHFAVWDEGADAEVAQVPCGGWRRPSATDVAAADDFAFCVLHDGRLWLYRRQPDPLAPPRCLHPPHHCKEQHCVRLLALPSLSSGQLTGGSSNGSEAEQAAAAAAAAGTSFCCITGGEDATVRQLLLPSQQDRPADCSVGGSSGSGSGSTGGLFSFAGLIAEQARGTAVKSLALLPLPAPQPGGQRHWLLLSAGARQTLLLSRLRQHEGQGGCSRPLPLLCDELAVKDPVASDKRTPRSQSLKLWSDLRYLSVSAFLAQRQPQQAQQGGQRPPATAAAGNSGQSMAGAAAAAAAAAPAEPAGAQQLLLFIVAAASDASLELLCSDLAGMPRQLGTGRRPDQFPAVARLRHHTCPVLSTAHCCLGLPGREGGVGQQDGSTGVAAGVCSSGSSGGPAVRHVAFSGATDGTAAVWDLTLAVAAATSIAAGLLGSAAQQAQQAQQELAPLLVLPSLHQSGVNCMAVVPAGEGRLLLLTGGDDQALCLTLLQLGGQPACVGSMGSSGGGGSSSNGNSGGISCRELLRLTIPNAHSSALRSAWLSPLLPAASSSRGSQGGCAASSGDAQPASSVAAVQPAAAAAAGSPAPARAAGDGVALHATAFTLGLDQQLRRWRLQLQTCQAGLSSGGHSGSWPELLLGLPEDQHLGEALTAEPWLEVARYSITSAPSSSPGGSGSCTDGGTSGGTAWQITAEEVGCRFTQVAEPAALDVLPCGDSQTTGLPGPSGSYVIAVAGRGTELLTWQS